MAEWIKCADEMPEIMAVVLIFIPEHEMGQNGGIYQAYTFPSSGSMFCIPALQFLGNKQYAATHWMPLPEPPQIEREVQHG